MLLARSLVSLCFLVSHTSAAPSQPGPRSTDSLFPVVKLDNGTFVGTISDITDSVHAYLGIPFAQRKSFNLLPVGESHKFATNTQSIPQRSAVSYSITLHTSREPCSTQPDITLQSWESAVPSPGPYWVVQLDDIHRHLLRPCLLPARRDSPAPHWVAGRSYQCDRE